MVSWRRVLLLSGRSSRFMLQAIALKHFSSTVTHLSSYYTSTGVETLRYSPGAYDDI